MNPPEKPQVYRDVIDALVHVCRHGPGQVGPERVRKGLWNQNATAESIPDQHEINLLLLRLAPEDRAIVARMLEHAVVTGVFQTLQVLERFEIEPFRDGYEGSPFNDFVGRLDDDEWEWPEPEPES